MTLYQHHLFLHELADGRATPLVCLHGFLGSGSEWSFLTLPDRPIWAVDLPGHGASIGLSDSAYSISGAAELAVSSLRTAGIDRFHLLGYSMGGRVAMEIAVRSPEVVESLLIESGNPGIPSARARQERAFLDDQRAGRLRTESLHGFLEEWYSQSVFANLSDNQRSNWIEAALSNDSDELARAIAGMSPGRQRDLRAELAAVDMPITYVCGERDDAYVRIGQDLAARDARVAQRIMPDCGHAVHRERPADFRDIVIRHLASVGQNHSQ
jgi:2-succinyl-6-hydroxy-2,4-cyclohexadiene-1-carboxylate synthase